MIPVLVERDYQQTKNLALLNQHLAQQQQTFSQETLGLQPDDIGGAQPTNSGQKQQPSAQIISSPLPKIEMHGRRIDKCSGGTPLDTANDGYVDEFGQYQGVAG